MKMKKNNFIILTIYLLSLVQVSCKDKAQELLIWNDPPSTADTLYQNPIFEPDLADPSFVKATDGWFYAYGTQNDWGKGLERLTPIIKSKDLVKWEYVNDAFTVNSRPKWKTDGGLWAPQIVFNAGTYYLYYSISGWGDSSPGIGVAKSVYPYGPFEDLGKVLDTQSSGVKNSIDQFFIEEGSGRDKKRYLFWGSFEGVWGIELSLTDMKTIKVGAVKFKIAGNSFEGTYIYKKNNKYYFFASSGNCCQGKDSKYRLTVSVSSNIKGPYTTKDGQSILTDGIEGTPFLVGNPSIGFVGPGHNAEIITDDTGHDYLLYHAIDYNNPNLPNGATRRPLMMDEVHWDADGWPYILTGFPSNILQRAPKFNIVQ